MYRDEVYDAIDSERDFQDEMTAKESRPDMIDDFHTGDALTAIDYNLTKAKEAWYKGSVPHPDTMEYLRKICAIAVKLGETHGMPKR